MSGVPGEVSKFSCVLPGPCRVFNGLLTSLNQSFLSAKQARTSPELPPFDDQVKLRNMQIPDGDTQITM